MSRLNQEGYTSKAGVTRRRFLSDSSKVLATTGIFGSGAASALLAACGGSTASGSSSSGPAVVTYTFDSFSKLSDAPAVSDAMSNTAHWNAVKVNGKIYGVPNQNYFAYVFGVFIDKTFADKYQQYIPATLTSYADIEPFLDQIKAHEPGITPVYMSDQGFAGGILFSGADYGIDTFSGSSSVAGIRYTDTQMKVFNVYESPEYRQAVELRWKWKQNSMLGDGTIQPA